MTVIGSYMMHTGNTYHAFVGPAGAERNVAENTIGLEILKPNLLQSCC